MTVFILSWLFAFYIVARPLSVSRIAVNFLQSVASVILPSLLTLLKHGTNAEFDLYSSCIVRRRSRNYETRFFTFGVFLSISLAIWRSISSILGSGETAGLFASVYLEESIVSNFALFYAECGLNCSPFSASLRLYVNDAICLILLGLLF